MRGDIYIAYLTQSTEADFDLLRENHSVTKTKFSLKTVQCCNIGGLVRRQHIISGTCHFLLHNILVDKEQSIQFKEPIIQTQSWKFKLEPT
jgi:hypothetical protein